MTNRNKHEKPDVVEIGDEVVPPPAAVDSVTDDYHG